jgi:hypothetical protein
METLVSTPTPYIFLPCAGPLLSPFSATTFQMIMPYLYFSRSNATSSVKPPLS